MIRTYFQMLLEEGMPGAEGKMKQFASWFTHGVPGGAALRKAIYEAKSGAEILGKVEEFFEAKTSHERARHLDLGSLARAARPYVGCRLMPIFPAPRVPHIPRVSGRHA